MIDLQIKVTVAPESKRHLRTLSLFDLPIKQRVQIVVGTSAVKLLTE